VGDSLFVGSCSGVFFSFDKANGDVRWAYDTTTDGTRANFHGDPVVTDRLVIVGSDVASGEEAEGTTIPDGYVYAFEQATGDVRWKFGLEGGIPSDLLRIDGSLYGVGNDGRLVCLEIGTGELRWSVGSESGTQSHAPRYSLLSFGDKIVFSGPQGLLTAVDPVSGKEIWTHQLHEEVNTTLVRAGGDFYVATDMETIYRLSSKSGAIRAQLPAPGLPFGTPIDLGDSLLVLLEGGDFARIDTDEGRVLWTRSIEDEWTSFRPRVLEDRVLVGSGDGELIALNLEDGALLESYRVHGAIRGFAASDGVLYIGTLGGRLFAHRM